MSFIYRFLLVLWHYSSFSHPHIFLIIFLSNILSAFVFLRFLSWLRIVWLYRVIHKSLRDFRSLRYCSRDGHAEGEHVNRVRDILNFCPTLQVLDISTLGDATDVKSCNQVPATHVQCTCVVGTWLQNLTSVASPRVDISRTCKVGQKFRMSLPLLTCSPRRDLPGYCTTEVEIPGGTYELPCLL